MSDTNKREATATSVFPIEELQMHLAHLMTDCKVERNEATSVAERMFCDGRILLLHELLLHLDVAAVNARYTPPVRAGRWEFENGIGDFAAGQRMIPCSECHTRQYAHLLDHYCPHCGVYMPEILSSNKVIADE